MRVLHLVLVLAALTAGCEKSPWSETSKEEKSHSQVNNTLTKNQLRKVKFIRSVQISLLNAGCYNGTVDGKSSNALRVAIKRFQKTEWFGAGWGLKYKDLTEIKRILE